MVDDLNMPVKAEMVFGGRKVLGQTEGVQVEWQSTTAEY